MERLYQETNVLLHEIHGEMLRLEQAGDESVAQFVSQAIHAKLRDLDGNCTKLDVLVGKEPPTRRHTVRMKVDQLKNDCQSVHLTMNALLKRLTTVWRIREEREELLKQRFTPNDTALTMDEHNLQMNHRLSTSNNRVDELISQGSAVLENLRSQHLNLKGVRRRFMDIGAQLGLSNTTLRMIERRVSEDWVVFVVGCIVTLIFMYSFYRFWMS